MGQIKNDIFRRLWVLLIFPLILSCLPMTAMKTQAESANVLFSWGYGLSYGIVDGVLKPRMITEEKQIFELGDFVRIGRNGNFKYASSLAGVKYSSSNISVASVSSKTGRIKTLSEGETDITLSYQGRYTVCRLTVVKKGQLGTNGSKYTNLKKKADAVVKTYGGKITAANRNLLSSQLSKLKYGNTVNYNGFKMKKQSNGRYAPSNELVVTNLAKTYIIKSKLASYITANNPIGTNYCRIFQIARVSAKGGTKTFSINLKKAVTATQIFAIKEGTSGNSYKNTKNSAKFKIYVQDGSSGKRYYGVATATAGSKKLTVKLNNLRLKSGNTYVLYGQEKNSRLPNTWTKGKLFRAV